MLALAYQIISIIIVTMEVEDEEKVKKRSDYTIEWIRKFINIKPELETCDGTTINEFDFQWIDITDKSIFLHIDPKKNYTFCLDIQFDDVETEQLWKEFSSRMSNFGEQIEWQCKVGPEKLPLDLYSIQLSNFWRQFDIVLSTLTSIFLLSWLYRIIFDSIHKIQTSKERKVETILIKKVISSGRCEIF